MKPPLRDYLMRQGINEGVLRLLTSKQRNLEEVYVMETELVVLEVEITSDGFTRLKYMDKSGHMHTNFDNLSLERVIEIFTQGKRLENVLLLSEGSARRDRKSVV